MDATRAAPAGSVLRLAAAPFVVTLAVMLIGIGDRQLWRDEHATWWAASLSLGDLRHLVSTVDAVLYPYYLLMHFWVGLFGASPAVLRLPSALFMAVAAGLVALVGRRLFDAPSGLVAGLLLPLVPAISRYGQEARPYAMTLAATVAAVLLLLRALEQPSAGRWAGYALVVLWVACSHAVALMALAAHLVAVLAAYRAAAGPERRRILVGWPLAVGGAGLLAAPLIVAARSQGQQISWIPDPVWARVQSFPGEVFLSAPVAGFLVVLGAAAIALAVAAGGQRRWVGVMLAGWAVLPPVLAYFTFHQLGLFYPRYVLFTVPAWVVAAAWALRRIAGSSRALASVALVTAVAVAVAAVPQQRFVRSDAVEDEIAFAAGAHYLGDQVLPGDSVIYTGYRKTHRGFSYELEQAGKPVPQEVLASPRARRPWSWERRKCTDPAGCLAGKTRVWLVSTDPRGEVLSSLLPYAQGVVAERYTVTGTRTFYRMRISLLVAK